MSYREFKPHQTLAPYIDAYWELRAIAITAYSHRILPDGCVDIILNLGEDVLTGTTAFKFKNETIALVGTMTRYIHTLNQGNTHMVGIRFKPLGFSYFYKHNVLGETANTTIEFEQSSIPDLRLATLDIGHTLDAFFIRKLSKKRNPLTEILMGIQRANGIISVQDVVKNHFVTPRQLERNFKSYLGISPKSYINFVRYQSAFQAIKQNAAKRSLLEIACDTGYYDHAHLTSEIKKHSGLAPSEWQ